MSTENYFAIRAFLPEFDREDEGGYTAGQLARFLEGESFTAFADRKMLFLFTEVFKKFPDFSVHAEFVLKLIGSGLLTVPWIGKTYNDNGIIIEGNQHETRPLISVQILLMSNKRIAVFSAINELLDYKSTKKGDNQSNIYRAQLLLELYSRQDEVDQFLKRIDASGNTTLTSMLNAATATIHVELPMESKESV